MNNSFDFNSKKYMILLVLICVLFAIFTIKIFDYMPKPVNEADDYNEEQVVDVNSPAQEDNIASKKNEDEEDSEEHKTGHFNFMPKQNHDEEGEYDEIDAPPGAVSEDIPANIQTSTTDLTNDERALRCIINGQKYKASSDYTNAMDEFQKVAELTDNNELKAMSFEAIAEIYAHQRRFGTALTFASKAYNLSPTSSREMLISRIYYKSGDTEKGIKRLNSMLQKSF